MSLALLDQHDLMILVYVAARGSPQGGVLAWCLVSDASRLVGFTFSIAHLVLRALQIILTYLSLRIHFRHV